MRSLFLIILLAAVSTAFACGQCGGRGGKCCDRPDWAVTYSDIHYMPSCAPKPLKCFWDTLIPMHEARVSHESAYIREGACRLSEIAKYVAKCDDKCCCEMNEKHYKRAAKDLRKDCEKLQELCYGGSNQAIYGQLQAVEQDFIRLSNLCEN
jgi:hypothetical protein